YNYDSNGNVLSDGARNITFDKMDRPIVVTMNGVTTLFQYAPDGSRYLQRTTGVPTNKTVYYVDKDYERIDWATGVSDQRSYIGGWAAAATPACSSRNVYYRHVDRLGSSEAMTTTAAAAVVEDTTEAHGFDAFGKPRARDWQPSGDKLHPGGDYCTVTEHGFTQHEHLDDTFLIHMNGRMYDYRPGKFLSAAPITSTPANSQSINPYSYIGNNPLSGVDPTGYVGQDTVKTPCETAGFCPHNGTLSEDAKFSSVLNGTHFTGA